MTQEVGGDDEQNGRIEAAHGGDEQRRTLGEERRRQAERLSGLINQPLLGDNRSGPNRGGKGRYGDNRDNALMLNDMASERSRGRDDRGRGRLWLLMMEKK
ncbi:hypothetical protein PIB30_015044 [Stylosanthes scabra]|uniref:Uncharacterized protein n=1 Tax=Stylosanthes scabra TaxID=79078 RepID=A0ABU6Z3P4_9FABA|nr:hypothetical protein [Stylosanthes scabra]